ncbi:MAG: gliding motility-associated C-terminal domain-containing protein [Bacteroidales bacterium]|nr:gliding motility-associated C-terminal domain-containing protein [Bacteroidales bacterium]
MIFRWLLSISLGAAVFSSAWGKTAGEGMAQVTDSIIAPNVFTPNDDDLHEFFEVTSSAGNAVSLKIFTRAGVLVFSIKAKTCRWDGCAPTGEKMAEGIYFYTAEVPGSSPKVSKNGFVYLFR